VKIKSEHVARVSDVGTLPHGAPYMVTEYLEGGDLAAWIKQRGALPIDQAAEFVLQACVAVADAHALGTATSSPRTCSASGARTGSQIGPRSSVTGRFKRVPFLGHERATPLARSHPLRPLTRHGRTRHRGRRTARHRHHRGADGVPGSDCGVCLGGHPGAQPPERRYAERRVMRSPSPLG
jgi:hypothetical protein